MCDDELVVFLKIVNSFRSNQNPLALMFELKQQIFATPKYFGATKNRKSYVE